MFFLHENAFRLSFSKTKKTATIVPFCVFFLFIVNEKSNSVNYLSVQFQSSLDSIQTSKNFMLLILRTTELLCLFDED